MKLVDSRLVLDVPAYSQCTIFTFENGIELRAYFDGRRKWLQNGKCHRDDGPALITSGGGKVWYRNNRIHREDGPAFVHADGTKSWYLDGDEMTESKWKRLKDISCKTTTNLVE